MDDFDDEDPRADPKAVLAALAKVAGTVLALFLGLMAVTYLPQS